MANQYISGSVGTGNGGLYPLVQVKVTVYAATTGNPVALGSGTTDAQGEFGFLIQAPSTDTVLYAVATVSANTVLMTVIGRQVCGSVVINELTTVAAAFSMAQFTDGTIISGSAAALGIAAGMNDNLVSTHTGHVSPVLMRPPNADQTCTLRAIRSLANLAAGCLRDEPGFDTELFFQLTTPPGGPRPANIFQALLNIARHPAWNAGALWTMSLEMKDVYWPALINPIDAWTLAVKVNATGNDDYLFGGPANVAFDGRGYAWVSNNVFQGTPDGCNFAVVLRPDGRPSRGELGTPASPVFGGGLKGPGWGVTVAPNGHAWVGNFGWGANVPSSGSVSEFFSYGTPISDEDAYDQGGTHMVQAVVSDADGNIWIASFDTGTVAVYPGGNPDAAQSKPAGAGTFGAAVAPDGTVWVSAGGGGLGWPPETVKPGYVSRWQLQNGQLTQLGGLVQVGYANKAIAVDSGGNAWLASSADGKVYQLNSSGQQVGQGHDGGGIDTPWGICVDGDDNVWVANFGVMGPESDYTTAALSKLKGANTQTPPYDLAPGDPISPPTGYTLPTGGDPVLLRTGEPLYKDGTECYSPLMRSTSCQIDQAGNVWVVNNWKPRFGTDFESGCGNPGGDGIVIFVGLAKPPRLPYVPATT